MRFQRGNQLCICCCHRTEHVNVGDAFRKLSPDEGNKRLNPWVYSGGHLGTRSSSWRRTESSHCVVAVASVDPLCLSG